MSRAARWLSIALVLVGLGCQSKGNGPSDTEVLGLVKQFVESKGNLCSERWKGVGRVGVGEVKEVKILERGTFNEQAKSLPVRAKLVGHCAWTDLSGGRVTGTEEKKPYDDVMECKIAQDDFGKWAVTEWSLKR